MKRQEEGDFALRADGSLGELSLAQLLALDEAAFRDRFRATPLWRSRREGLLRNALIVVANGEHEDCRSAVRHLCDDPSETLRETAAWCLQRLDAALPRNL
jgi:epoxyqueuosine reductase